MADIAKAAGVGRVTLYAHFASRTQLVEAVTARAIEAGDVTLDAVDLTGDPRAALLRLIDTSWFVIVRVGALVTAASATLSADQMRRLHAAPSRRVEELVRRGQEEGAFRDDVSTSWLVEVLHSIMHGAAAEIGAGRMRDSAAPAAIGAIVLAAFTAPGRLVPDVAQDEQ